MSDIRKISDQAEKPFLQPGGRFDRTEVRRVIEATRRSIDDMKNKDGPGVKSAQDALRKLELEYGNAKGTSLSDPDKAKIRTAVQGVSAARANALRENLPDNQYKRIQGDDPGIHRDQEGNIVRSDPGARTVMEKAQDKSPYAVSGKKTYTKGATAAQVDAGRSLREGDYDVGKDGGVKRFQELLKGAGYDPGKVDGFLGPQTRKAWDQFRQAHKIQSDSIGRDELALLEKLKGQGAQTYL